MCKNIFKLISGILLLIVSIICFILAANQKELNILTFSLAIGAGVGASCALDLIKQSYD